MSNYNQTRILMIGDEKLYRIFSFAFEKDKFGEPYFKLILRPLFGEPLVLAKIEPNEVAIAKSPKELESLSSGVHEVSYHYENGRTHFKGKSGNYLSEIQWPKLSEAGFAEIGRVIVYDFTGIKESKKVSDTDVIIKQPFQKGESRSMNVYLTTVNIRLHNSDERFNFNNYYKIQFPGYDNVTVVIADNSYLEECEGVGIGFMRPNDSTGSRIKS